MGMEVFMKKTIFLCAAALVLTGFAVSQVTSPTITFNATVNKYVGVNPNFNPGTLVWGSLTPPGPGAPLPVNGPGQIRLLDQTVSRTQEFGYANCPFRITVNGSNEAGDIVPCFAKLENTIAGPARYDKLLTMMIFHFVLYDAMPVYPNNWYWNSCTFNTGHGAGTQGIPGVWAWQSGTWPVPHNGDIYSVIEVNAGLPYNTPDWNVSNLYNQSADAGLYKAYVTFTISAI
jgi:hypothetical protein